MSTQIQTKTLSLRFKLLIPLMILITIIFLLTYFGLQYFLNDTIRGIMDEEIQTVMDLTMQCLNANDLQALTQDAKYNPSAGWPGGMTDPRYWKEQSCLAEVDRYNPRSLVFTYYRVDQNTLAYGLDEMATVSPSESMPFGETITAAKDDDFSFMVDGLTELYLYDTLYYDKEYGAYYYGATAPIKNSSGETIGGLAIYIDANLAAENLAYLSKALLIVFAIVYILVAAIVLWITGSVTLQLRALKTASSRVAEGDYAPISIRLQIIGDEVSVLAGIFNIMLDKVRGREETLKKRVVELEIIVDAEKRKKQVDEIVDTEFFQDLKSRATQIRARQPKKEE